MAESLENLERLYKDMQERTDDIFKLDTDNLRIFTEMKSKAADVQKEAKTVSFATKDPQLENIQQSQLCCLHELDKDNEQQREQLMADVIKMQAKLNEKFDHIQETIRLHLEERQSLKQTNEAKFLEIQEYFEKISKRFMNLNKSANRWLNELTGYRRM